MVLHIALEGIDGVGKTTITRKLEEFFQKKKYKVRLCRQPDHKPVHEILRHYNLLNHELALLMAFDRSLTYYMEDWSQYDIVIWDRSILSSYAYNTDEAVTDNYIQSINRFFPEMDLYIVIKHNKILDKFDYTDREDVIENYDRLIQTYPNTIGIEYIEGDIEAVFKNTIQAIFDQLPRCQWCGRLYTVNKHNKKYCSDECRKYSRQEQNRNNRNRFYHKYKDVLAEHEKGSLGSKGSLLHEHPVNDFKREHELIQKEKYRQGIR